VTLRRTLSTLAFPKDAVNQELAVEWAKGAAIQILRWMWLSFDRLRANHLVHVDLRQPIDQLERSLTLYHFIDLQQTIGEDTGGFSSLVPVHECEEFESLSSPRARPPTYDFGFVHVDHRPWVWPIEAKVLKTPTALHEYMSDLHDKFVAGIAAPLTGEGGMIAYLLSGDADSVFSNLQERLSTPLEPRREYTDRPYRVSCHLRNTAPPLRLHHMVMACY
jgi:hypothetical protein